MPLDPLIRKLLDAAAAGPRPQDMTISEAREHIRRRVAAIPPNQSRIGPVADISINLSSGLAPARLYRPDTACEDVPLIVFFHGGGWAVCDIGTHDGQCRRICHESGAAVLSVDYVLAPEAPFPAAFEQCVEATEWSKTGLSDYGIDGSRIAVCGDSAGGNLAAAVSLAMRDRNMGIPEAQALIYPALAPFHCEFRSRRDFADGFGLDASQIEKYWYQYLPGYSGPASTSPYAAPLLAIDFSGLPQTYILTAEYDPLRDEAEHYAQELLAAGVPVSAQRVHGVNHGFLALETILPQADQSMVRLGRWLSQSLSI